MGASEIPCAPSSFVQRAGSRERDGGDVLSLRDGQPGTVGWRAATGEGTWLTPKHVDLTGTPTSGHSAMRRPVAVSSSRGWPTREITWSPRGRSRMPGSASAIGLRWSHRPSDTDHTPRRRAGSVDSSPPLPPSPRSQDEPIDVEPATGCHLAVHDCRCRQQTRAVQRGGIGEREHRVVDHGRPNSARVEG